MKISPDQNTITLDDGTVLVAKCAESGSCDGCHFDYNDSECHKRTNDMPCWSYNRNDGMPAIFIKEPK